MSSNPITRKLAHLRSQLNRWILVHGLARWLLVGLGILVIDMGLDRLFRMDYAQRLVMLVVMAGLIAAYFVWRVLRPFRTRPTDDALIYEIERKHPELGESLLTGMQLSRQTNLATLGISPTLAEAAIEQGMSRAAAMDFGDTLDQQQHRINWLLLGAGVICAAVLAWGVGQTEFLHTWFNRNVLLLDDQWPQATYLEIDGVQDGQLTLSRGTDHRQLVTVAERSRVTDVSITLEVDNPGGRSLLPMKTTGKLDGREHLYTFHNVSSRFRFRAMGGDDVTEWVEVNLVEPPNISKLQLTARLPAYTGIDSEELTGIGPHALLQGSRLQVAIETNKSLSAASVLLGAEHFPMQPGANDQSFSVMLPGEGDLQGGDYELELKDTSGRSNTRRSKFKITIKEDRPPQVRATLLGISGLVVPRANLPTSYQAADEYGLTELSFDCNWKYGLDESSQSQQRSIVFASAGDEGPLKDPARQVKDFAVLDLRPLDLQPGSSLRFMVAAADNYPTPANIGQSQEFLLRVVSEEELRADLLRREIEQRKAFDEAYQNQLALTTELQAIVVRRRPETMAPEEFDAQREANLIAAVRSQKGVGTSIARVADRFEEFLVEIKNNRLDEAENEIAPDQRIEKRFDEKIIQPIRRLDQELVTLAARHLDSCRTVASQPEQLAQAAVVANAVQEEILMEMKQILAAMSDSENFQGIINDILEVKRDTDAIKQGIGDQAKPVEDIFDDKDVFDK